MVTLSPFEHATARAKPEMELAVDDAAVIVRIGNAAASTPTKAGPVSAAGVVETGVHAPENEDGQSASSRRVLGQ